MCQNDQVSNEGINGQPCPINLVKDLHVSGYTGETPFVCTGCEKRCSLRRFEIQGVDWNTIYGVQFATRSSVPEVMTNKGSVFPRGTFMRSST